MRPDGSRVVVTGMGIITGLGDDLDTYWAGLQAGRSGIGKWQAKDPRIDSKIGGDLSGFQLDAHLQRIGHRYPTPMVAAARKLLRTTPVGGVLTAAAAMQAFSDAGLQDSKFDPDRLAHVCAGHNTTLPYFLENLKSFDEDPEYIEPLFGMLALDTDTVGLVSELVCARGPSFLVGGACASGNLALISALDLLRSGRADKAIVTGAPSPLGSIILQGWAMMEALSYKSFNDEPHRASRPFDAKREGFVPSEGAGALVLETLEGARRRGARIRGELLGGAASSDANRLTKPHRDGQERAMRGALSDGGVNAEQVDYVNAHATSTPLGDAVEVGAIKSVLGPRAYQVPVNSTKSMVGHCLTSAAVVELIATFLQLEHGIVHPTINQEHKDPELDLDFVPNRAREHRIKVAISNSFGFGGINSCVVVGAPP